MLQVPLPKTLRNGQIRESLLFPEHILYSNMKDQIMKP